MQCDNCGKRRDFSFAGWITIYGLRPTDPQKLGLVERPDLCSAECFWEWIHDYKLASTAEEA
jgi:hypothetical protein